MTARGAAADGGGEGSRAKAQRSRGAQPRPAPGVCVSLSLSLSHLPHKMCHVLKCVMWSRVRELCLSYVCACVCVYVQTRHKLAAAEGSLARLEEHHAHNISSHENSMQEVLKEKIITVRFVSPVSHRNESYLTQGCVVAHM